MKPFSVNNVRAISNQPLRNVRMHAPSMVQIVKGVKILFWQDLEIRITRSDFLLSAPPSSFSFCNRPEDGEFSARIFSFAYQPPLELIELSLSNSPSNSLIPAVKATQALQTTLNILAGLDTQNMSQKAMQFWLLGLYQQMAEQGLLHRVFASPSLSMSQQVSRYIAQNPSENHGLEAVASHFAMSRATLIRRLKQEQTQFKEVLIDVRLAHAIELMQQGCFDMTQLALRCGYQSASRFSQKFHDRFGLSLKEYIASVA